ncbi:MAG: hypothetical protein QW815_09080 [Nitrososphaerota archaeon]
MFLVMVRDMMPGRHVLPQTHGIAELYFLLKMRYVGTQVEYVAPTFR